MAADYRAGKVGYGQAKKILKGRMEEYFAPFRDKRKELAKDPGRVDDILRHGAKKARAEAEATMELVRAAVGLKG